MRTRTKSLAVVIATATSLLFAGIAAPQAGAASVVFSPGAYTANTTAMTLAGPGVSAHGTNVGGVAVFKFDAITIPFGTTITATGSRPFELLATGALVVGGKIDARGTNAVDFATAATPAGAGGGAGGKNATKGSGPGGGGISTSIANGAGGGGFGGPGARGANDGVGTTAPGGVAYGNLDLKLQGGSGGGGAGTTQGAGGGGGGAIGLFGASVTLQPTGVVTASGGNGAAGGNGASGGGSGGGIIIHANSVDLGGELTAVGGGGGSGGCCGDGGGGSGGRIAIHYKSFVLRNSFAWAVNGGASGSVSGCCTPGTPSLDANGGNGKLTFAQIDLSTLTMGASKTIARGATVALPTKLTDGGTGAAIGGQPVTLYKRATPTGSAWTAVITVTTSATGTATNSQKPTASTVYQWRFAGTLTHAAVNSAQQTITVQ